MKNPLKIPLASLKQGENKLNFSLQPYDLDLRPREVAENPSFEFFVGPVGVALVITRSGLRLMVTGSVSYRAKLECAMCGSEYECDFDEPVTAEFLSCDDEAELAVGTAPVRGELRPECEQQGGLSGNWLDLLPMVRDAIHLAVPIAPRCRCDCRGLCPVCGADLNSGPCQCAAGRAPKAGPARSSD